MCLRIFSPVFESSIKHSVMRRRRKLRRCTRRSVRCSFVQKQGSFEVIGTLGLIVKFCCSFMKTKVLNQIEQISSEYGSFNQIFCCSDWTEMKRYGNDMVEVISYFSQKTTKHTPTDTYPSIVGRIYPIQIYLQLTCISQMLAADI